MDQYPSLRPAESLVFCVDDACIFEALNCIKVVNDFAIILVESRLIMFIILKNKLTFISLNYYFIHLIIKLNIF